MNGKRAFQTLKDVRVKMHLNGDGVVHRAEYSELLTTGQLVKFRVDVQDNGINRLYSVHEQFKGQGWIEVESTGSNANVPSCFWICDKIVTKRLVALNKGGGE